MFFSEVISRRAWQTPKCPLARLEVASVAREAPVRDSPHASARGLCSCRDRETDRLAPSLNSSPKFKGAAMPSVRALLLLLALAEAEGLDGEKGRVRR